VIDPEGDEPAPSDEFAARHVDSKEALAACFVPISYFVCEAGDRVTAVAYSRLHAGGVATA